MLIEPAVAKTRPVKIVVRPLQMIAAKKHPRFSGMNKHPIFITIEKNNLSHEKIFYHENAGNAAVLLRNIYQLRPTATSGSAYR